MSPIHGHIGDGLRLGSPLYSQKTGFGWWFSEWRLPYLHLLCFLQRFAHGLEVYGPSIWMSTGVLAEDWSYQVEVLEKTMLAIILFYSPIIGVLLPSAGLEATHTHTHIYIYTYLQNTNGRNPLNVCNRQSPLVFTSVGRLEQWMPMGSSICQIEVTVQHLTILRILIFDDVSNIWMDIFNTPNIWWVIEPTFGWYLDGISRFLSKKHLILKVLIIIISHHKPLLTMINHYFLPWRQWTPKFFPFPLRATPPHDPPSCWPWSPRNMNASASQPSLCQVKDLKCHGRLNWDWDWDKV